MTYIPIAVVASASLLSTLLDPIARALKRMFGDVVQKGKDLAQKELDSYKGRIDDALVSAASQLDTWIVRNQELVINNRDGFVALVRDKVLEFVPEETWPETIRLFFYGVLDTALLPPLKAVITTQAAPTVAKLRDNVRKEFDRARDRVKGWRL